MSELVLRGRAWVYPDNVAIDGDLMALEWALKRETRPEVLREHVFSNHRYDGANGDLLVFYTDGVTEARNANGTEFGIETLEAILRSPLSTPEALLSRMLAQLRAHQGSNIGNDDQTLIVLRLSGAPRPSVAV